MSQIWHRPPGFKYRRLSRPVIASAYTYQDGDLESWHSHHQPQFVFTTRGVLRITTPGGAWTLGPRRGLWLPSRVGHELQAIGEIDLYSVYIEAEMSPWEGDECRVLVISPLLRELVAAMEEDRRLARDHRAELIIPLLLREMCDAPQAHEGSLPLPQDRRLQQICERLIAEPGNNDTLDQWGERVGASERTLGRLFKTETGLAFGQWRLQLRLAESVSRLARGMTVATIAAELGYRNSSAFIAMFRKATGQTPQRYLKSPQDEPA
ncbi:helix-turn-helix transcriptional regulator [Candidimonas humi]|jgi:AraC-like DNA-binding protein|uniref:AraC family transcriptional regulator n=1 Tax=Candidimonas humi TaxID=683355 RepID=A0ABV8P5B6_9BURK|nr:helix-turn-helix transcriptional regulator [Candidimonas humi]MBV6307082.1 helix-turn-helix transcriptional regulator [Candidimonas humi]